MPFTEKEICSAFKNRNRRPKAHHAGRSCI